MSSIALVDDHVLLRNGLAGLISNLGHDILFEADNGRDFIEQLEKTKLPDIVLMDINMPVMDGYDTTKWLKKNHPDVKVIALSMYDNESSIIRMLKSGAKGYILKDSEPSQLKEALTDVMQIGFYYSDVVTGKLVHAISQIENNDTELKTLIKLNDRERDFLKHICSDLTYKEIADIMFVSPRTIDGYRDTLFEKLHARTRVGLVMYAIRNELVDINH